MRAWLARIGNEDVRILRWTVKRRVILLGAVLVVALAILIPVFIAVSSREVTLHYERTDIDAAQSFRYNDGVLFYETSNYYVTIKPDTETRVSLAEKLATADGYDMSAENTIVYLGSSAQIKGTESTQDEFVMADGATILSVRAGRRYCALLYRNQNGESRIAVVDAVSRPKTAVVATIAVAGGEVTAFGFLQADEETELLWVSTLDVNQFSEESLVRIYDCDNRGALIFYSASLYNQTIESALLTSNCLYLVGTQDVLRYDRTESGFSSERTRVNIYGNRVIDWAETSDGASAYFLLLPRTENGEHTHIYRLLTVSQSDEIWATMQQRFMPAPILSAYLLSDSINIITDEAFVRYSYSGRLRLDLAFTDTPTKAIPCEEDAFLLVMNGGVYRVYAA